MPYASNSGITFGDSIMSYGWDLQLSQAVIPMSRNGTGTKGFTGTAPTIGDTFASVTPTRRADCNFLVLNGGVNDDKNFATPIATVKTAAEAVIDAALALSGMDYVFVWNISPWGNYPGYDAGNQAFLDEYNAWLASIESSKGFILVDMYSALGDPSTPSVLLAEYDSGDHLHPSPAGVRKQRDVMLALFETYNIIQENDVQNFAYGVRGAVQPSTFNASGGNECKRWRGGSQPRYADTSILQNQTVGANYTWDRSGYGLVLLDRNLTTQEETDLQSSLQAKAGL